VALAGKCFGPTSSSVKADTDDDQYSRVYSIGYKISRQKRLRLVCVRASKELGVMFHGSAEKIAETLATGRTVAITEKEVYI
jgi:hypothetical protein